MDLGEAVLTLKVDGKEYSYQLGEAKDKANDLDKVHKKSKGTLGELKLAYVAVAAAIGKTVQFAGQLLDAWLEQEKAEQRLAAAVKITGQQRTVNVEGLKQFAAQLQSTTNIEEEATMASMGLLMQLAGLNERGVRKAIPLLQDFASLMGMDLTQATELFAKSLASDTNALSRYGIQIKDGLSPSEKFAAILGQMEEKAGGFAAEMAKSTGGQLQSFKIQIDELKETVGGFIAQGLAPLISNLNTLFSVIESAKQSKKKIIEMDSTELVAYISNLEKMRAKVQENLTNFQKLPFGGKSIVGGTEMIKLSEKALADYTLVIDAATKRLGELNVSQGETNTVFAEGREPVIELTDEEKKLVEAIESISAAQAAASAMTTEKYLAGQAEIQKGINQEIKSEQDRVAAAAAREKYIVDGLKAEAEARIAAALSAKEIEEESAKAATQAWLDSATQVVGIMQSFAAQIGSIFSQLNANRMSEIAAWYAAEKSRIESSVDDETERAEALEALDSEYAKKKYEAEVASFNTNKAIQIANAAINTAGAIIKFLVDPGGIAGIGLSIAAGVLGAVQMGVIAAQVPPPPPAFAEGGSFTVPPGYPDDSFAMRVQSGEQVDVTPAGEGGGMTHIPIYLDGKLFADFIYEGTKDGRVRVHQRGFVTR